MCLNLPSLLQVKVVDRTAIITANAETKVVSPTGIQEAIDAETGKLIMLHMPNFTVKYV